MMATWPDLLSAFARISLLAVGGANAVLPEVYRLVVTEHGWLDRAQFVALYAVAQAAPGPNVLYVTLLGWQIAGMPGALASTLGMIGPTSVLAWYVSGVWHRYRDRVWRQRLQTALAPVTAGLVLGSAWLICQGANVSLRHWLLCALAVAAGLWTRINPLYLLLGGALAGIVAGL